MWSKITLRIKITVLTAALLTVMCVSLTAISIYNSNVFYEPIEFIADIQPISINTSEQAGIPIIPNENDIKVIDDIFLGSRNTFKVHSVISSFIIVILGTGLSYLIAGKTLEPLNNLAGKIEEIDENNLSGCIELSPNGDEVARLTKSFNSMLTKLDSAFQAKKLFASNAAHELKTPLTNILTNIEVMQMDDTPSVDDYEEIIGITKENVERLTVLVHDLLRFYAKHDDGFFENFQTNELFDKIVFDLSSSIKEKGIKITIDGSIDICGEKTLLERAFFNLIQNAVKYNKDNGEIIILAADETITIEDSGIGIPSESISQIFDPFYCVDKSRSRRLGGNGLGLCISKQIFDKHNMTITISSEINKGTKVIVTSLDVPFFKRLR